MKSVASGCITWIIAFLLILTCLCPMAAAVAGVSSTLSSDWVAKTMEPYLCPAGSTAKINTFNTTTTDEFGNESPATGYEMECVDAQGNTTRESSPDYAFYWVGILMLGGLILSGILAFLLAAPVGILVARFTNRNKKTSV